METRAKIEYKLSKFGKFQRNRKGAFLKCKTCEKEFYVHPSRLKLGVVNFCSKKCYGLSIVGKNNPFFRRTHTIESKNKMRNHPNRVRFTTENNPNITRFAKGVFIGKSFSWWRNWIKTNIHSCEKCGFDNKDILMIHHKDRNNKNNYRENLILLCPNCHMLEHFNKRDGLYKWFKKQQ